MRRFYQSAIFYVLIILVIIGVLQLVMSAGPARTPITWTQFESAVSHHQVTNLQVTVDSSTLQLDGTLKNGTLFTARGLYSSAIADKISSLPHVTVTAPQKDTSWLSLIGVIVPILFIVFILFAPGGIAGLVERARLVLHRRASGASS
jgi:cell division protease FtsH